MNTCKNKNRQATPPISRALPKEENEWLSRGFLIAALIAAVVVYWPSLSGGWFYDDTDYIVNDPRLDHLELFFPPHWNDPPPTLVDAGEGIPPLPGYGLHHIITDRYLWRLSFALERWAFGAHYSPKVAHAISLLIHLAAVTALFWTLRLLLQLYFDDEEERERLAKSDIARRKAWLLLPGLAALIFAIHPWVAEPVCYLSARSRSMGTVFSLFGLGLWIKIFLRGAVWWKRFLLILGAMLAVVAACLCKDNFISVIAGYIFVVAPALLRRAWRQSRILTALGVATTVCLLLVVAWLGIRISERARDLFAISSGGRGWEYFFEIQNPLLLLTLLDQALAQRLALETNHPGWVAWACWSGLATNVALFALGILGSLRWPLLMGIGWFYLNLLPTNSFLPREDFLAMRNVYLPAAGTAVLLAGLLLWGWTYLKKKDDASASFNKRRWPDSWWPKAARGIAEAQGKSAERITDAALKNLEAAEKAENAFAPALRLLQQRALFWLAQGLARSSATRARAWALVERMEKLGCAKTNLRELTRILKEL